MVAVLDIRKFLNYQIKIMPLYPTADLLACICLITVEPGIIYFYCFSIRNKGIFYIQIVLIEICIRN